MEVVVTDDEVETQGVNDRVQLEALERSLQLRQAEELMASGVRLLDKHRFDLRGRLNCAEDVSIDVNVVIEGDVQIARGAVIEPNCVLKDCTIGEGAIIRSFSHIEGASVGADCQVGPYARLRPGAELSAKAKVGNFVEVKNSHLVRALRQTILLMLAMLKWALAQISEPVPLPAITMVLTSIGLS